MDPQSHCPPPAPALCGSSVGRRRRQQTEEDRPRHQQSSDQSRGAADIKAEGRSLPRRKGSQLDAAVGLKLLAGERTRNRPAGSMAETSVNELKP